MSTHPIYLDHNATTPVLPEVADAMRDGYRQGWANPASQHGPGRSARRVVEEAREQIVAMLGGQTTGMAADRLVFTSGGTEANNLALLGMGDLARQHLVISAIEHASVSETASWLAARGCRVDRLPTSPLGVVQLDRLEHSLVAGPRLVSVMLANNETGAWQPLPALADAAARFGIPVHTDAVQVAGKCPVAFRELGVAALTVSAHKFHGPRGIGGLLIRHDVPLRRQLHGGHQQYGLRPGSEPVELVVGMRRALELATQDRERRVRLAALRDRFEAELCERVGSAVVVSRGAERVPQTSCIAFPGLDRQALMMALDLHGIACSTGSACASGSSEPSPVLQAMQLPLEVVQGAVRFSVGAQQTETEIVAAALRVSQVVTDLAARKTARQGL